MKKMGGFLGILGLVLFLFGLVGALALGDAFGLPLLAAHMVLGAALLLVWLVVDGIKSLGNAGDVVMGRTARFSVSAFFYILLFVVIVGFVNYLGHKKAKRFDTTSENIFSLSPQSESVVEKLQKPLKLVGFKGVAKNIDDGEVQRILDLYRAANGAKVTVEMLDPRTNPFLVETTYEMKAGNLLYIQYGADDDANKNASRINEISEQSITNAVLKLTRGAARKIYIAQGDAEPGMTDGSEKGIKGLVDALRDENLNAEKVFLSETGGVPEDAAALLVIAPENQLAPSARDAIIKYVESGGRALLSTDPLKPDGITVIARHFGITIGKDLVVDFVQRLFGPAAIGAQVIARSYGVSPITQSFDENATTIFNIAASVKGDTAKEGVTYTDLVRSGPSSWAETNLDAIFSADKPSAVFDESQDTRGPVSIGVSYEKKLAGEEAPADDQKFEKTSRLVVFGDSNWLLNETLGNPPNRDLVLNAVNWLAGEEGGVTIRPKSLKTSIAPISRDQFVIILTSSLVIPELLLIAGLFVWWRRKQVA